MNKKAFTLFEIVLALIIFSMFIGIIFTTYINIKESELDIGNQQLIIKESNNILDIIHDLSLNYTIDYEEYFNRKVVGCLSDGDYSWSNSGSCNLFTSYGNSGNLYYCSESDGRQSGYNYYKFDINGCIQPGSQAFGQYNKQFGNIEDGHINDGKDLFLGKGPISIGQNTGVQELYLINNNGDHRVYFRRKYITGVDLNGDGLFTGKNESLYTIQILKLKGFDAGVYHNFDTGAWGTYDGFIDTRACDAEAGFICSGDLVLSGIYYDYRLPLDIDDGRVDIMDFKATISDWNFELYPSKDPYSSQNDSDYLFDPYIVVNLTTNIYGKQTNEEITLQTAFSLKNSYYNFEIKELTGFLP